MFEDFSSLVLCGLYPILRDPNARQDTISRVNPNHKTNSTRHISKYHLIQEMHRKNIVHRDIKSDNIMLHHGIYKICDLGFAKCIQPGIMQHTALGTITYMAPEVRRQESYGLKADIWSIGVVLYEMVFGVLPFDPEAPEHMYD